MAEENVSSQDDKSKFRILLVTSDRFPPRRPAARAIFSEEFTARGQAVDWLIQANESFQFTSKPKLGNGVVYLAPSDPGTSFFRRIRKHLLRLKNDLKVFKLARQNQYDVIQVKDKYVGVFFAIVAAKLTRTPIAYWLAYPRAEASIYAAKDNVARYRALYFLRGVIFKFLLYRIILRAVDHVFVQSAQMREDVALEGVPLSKMTPIPGSVNLASIPYRHAREPSLPGNADEKMILYLGTLLRERRLDFLLRVLKEVRDVVPTAKLYFIGKGESPEDDEFLVAESMRLGIQDAVVFTGYLPMEAAWEYIRRADVCVSPFFPTPILNSTSPTKLVEYMAMGKAVVGNSHPEQSLVLEKSGGGICTPWDESAFAQAINRLLKDPALAAEMGRKGRRYIELNRTNTVMADRVLAVYARICNRRPVGRRGD